MVAERSRCIEDFRLSRAQSLSPGAARTVDLLAAMMAREGRFCSVCSLQINRPVVEGDEREARR